MKTKNYSILVYGSGGREHALSLKLSKSKLLKKLYLAKPNDGFKDLGEEINFSNYKELVHKCKDFSIDIAIIGPEAPLADGLADMLEQNGVKCIGANSKWIKLESSKSFAKAFMEKYKIPTAKYEVITKTEEIDTAINTLKEPPVIKADGLTGGKGVYLSESMPEAKEKIIEYLNGKFGNASKRVVLEERLYGKELSLISLFDGKKLLPLITARDYKRLRNGQKGLNTGGMGSYAPVKLTKDENQELNNYLKLLEKALISEKADFTGIIYSGLILTKSGIKVLEYNMRFGDSECQSIIELLENDLLEIFVNMSEQKLDKVKLKWRNGVSLCVVIASAGYPINPKKGSKIIIPKNRTRQIYFAGVKKIDKTLYANGGRILNICTTAKDIEKAREMAYAVVKEIEFEDKIYRTDIGL